MVCNEKAIHETATLRDVPLIMTVMNARELAAQNITCLYYYVGDCQKNMIRPSNLPAEQRTVCALRYAAA